MPADGTIVAAYCHERRYRHIPFSGSSRTNRSGPSDVVLYQELNAPKRSRPLIGVIHANTCAQEVDPTTDQVIGYALPTANYTRSLSCRNVMI
jgi:hypothetical protein